jgi:hypothetical protein
MTITMRSALNATLDPATVVGGDGEAVAVGEVAGSDVLDGLAKVEVNVVDEESVDAFLMPNFSL